jgi:hypothetical protein
MEFVKAIHRNADGCIHTFILPKATSKPSTVFKRIRASAPGLERVTKALPVARAKAIMLQFWLWGLSKPSA